MPHRRAADNGRRREPLNTTLRKPAASRGATIFALAGVSLAFAAAAWAGVPDPRYTDADTSLVISPGGAFPYAVQLRDDSLAPVANTDVLLDFTLAIGIQLCAASDPDGDRRVVAHTDATGRAVFRVRGGGKSNGAVHLVALASLLRVAYVRSTDLNADLLVDATDVTQHEALPANARAGDYDSDGDSDNVDEAFVQDQVGQNCFTVPVLPATWSRVKSLYR